MFVFEKLEDATAILRLPKGVQKQVPMYRRGKRIYVPHGSGYIEVRGKTHTSQETSSGAYATIHPDVQVLDFEMSSQHKTEHVNDIGQQCLRMK